MKLNKYEALFLVFVFLLSSVLVIYNAVISLPPDVAYVQSSVSPMPTEQSRSESLLQPISSVSDDESNLTPITEDDSSYEVSVVLQQEALSAHSDTTPVTTPPENHKININTATIEELKTLSGIGDVLAQRIIDYRDQNGDFTSITQIKNVTGIGDKRYAAIKENICVD